MDAIKRWQDPAIQAFLDPILSIDLDDAMALCEKGLDGPALAEFFEETAARPSRRRDRRRGAPWRMRSAAFPSAKGVTRSRERCRASTR